MMEKTVDCWNLPYEMEFILSLALGKKPLTIPENIDWQKFEDCVDKNRIDPLVADGLKQFPQDVIKQYPVLEKIYSSHNSYAIFSMRQMQNLVMIMKAFEEADIRAISVKGPILGIALYGNPALRYSRDLDLLVSEDMLDKACEQLEKLGFKEVITVFNKTPLRRRKLEEKDEEMHRVYEKESIVIELHWRLSFRVDESFDTLWENRNIKTVLGQKINCLGEYDNITYLICHAAGHGYSRLRWLLDIYELQKNKKISWDAIYEKAKKQNIGALVIETVLMMYLISAFDMQDLECYFWTLKRDRRRIRLQYHDQVQKDIETGYKLIQSVHTILFENGIKRGVESRKYEYLLPTMGRKKSIIQSVLSVTEPRKVDLELIDLPDYLYFLYYIIHPIYKLWRMMPFNKNNI